MTEQWKKLSVKKITLAMWVLPRFGKTYHENRLAHGLVLNDEGKDNTYFFSDGRVLHTKGNELFYLPKGSTYRVKSADNSNCYAINFDAELSEEPFSIPIRDPEPMRKLFRDAAKEWKAHSDTRELSAMSALYEIVRLMIKENEREYHPSGHATLLDPAVKAMETRFSENSLSVAELSELCGVSEVYFRKMFQDRFGISPKEYLIRMRIEYAKSLLLSEQFSVSEVAALCGYSEPCHFSREFSKRVGVTPSQFPHK